MSGQGASLPAGLIRPDPTRRGGVWPVAPHLRPAPLDTSNPALVECDTFTLQEAVDGSPIGYRVERMEFFRLHRYAVAGEA